MLTFQTSTKMIKICDLSFPVSVRPDPNIQEKLLLSRSSLEPLISLDLVGTKLYCFRARVHCYYCLYIIFSANPVRRSQELCGDVLRSLTVFRIIRNEKKVLIHGV